MFKINRPLVKEQAKQIIRGKVFQLFIISIIVTALTGIAGTGVNLNYNINNNNNNSNDPFGYFEDFEGGEFNPIEDFSFNSSTENVEATELSVVDNKTASVLPFGIFSGFSTIAIIASFVFIPLAVTLAGMYLSLVRRNANENFDFGKELGGVFKNSFNNTFVNKLVLMLLVELFIVLWSILFIVPGIVFFYSAYFAKQIMVDNPNLKPMEAIRLSKKMCKGNRTELFMYDLSFIPWYLLTAISFGIASIYVIPYKSTTDALYYENFRLRALAQGVITEDDFLSEQERMLKYSNNQQNYYTDANSQNTYYQPQGTNVNNGVFYTPDFSAPQADNQQPPQSEQGNYYYTPQENEQSQTYYQTPEESQTQAGEYYTPPQEQPTDDNNGNTDNQ